MERDGGAAVEALRRAGVHNLLLEPEQRLKLYINLKWNNGELPASRAAH